MKQYTLTPMKSGILSNTKGLMDAGFGTPASCLEIRLRANTTMMKNEVCRRAVLIICRSVVFWALKNTNGPIQITYAITNIRYARSWVTPFQHIGWPCSSFKSLTQLTLASDLGTSTGVSHSILQVQHIFIVAVISLAVGERSFLQVLNRFECLVDWCKCSFVSSTVLSVIFGLCSVCIR